MDALHIATDLFEGLADQGIRYVHWKSNEHLGPALRGETDLDLLVAADQKQRFRAIVDKLGFIVTAPPRARRIPESETYFGLDAETGKLLHLDVQYRLVLGERLLKNHLLPLEQWLFDDAPSIEEVRVPKPERELLLLYVRIMLKTTVRQLLRSRLRGGSPIPERTRNEATWLADRVTSASLDDAARTSGLDLAGADLIEFRDRALQGRLDRDYVTTTRRSARTRLRRYHRLPAHRAWPRRLLLRVRSATWAEKSGMGIPMRRLVPRGLVVAVVGADGSGKTRLTRDLESWLAPKLTVRHFYFGQPKGGLLYKLVNKPGSVARHRGDDSSQGLLGLARYTDALKWAMLARRRRLSADRAHEMAATGSIVIAERFPLSDFFSMEAPMDGPRLQSNHGGAAMPLSGYEWRQYEKIAKPDLLLILDADLATLRGRKLDLGVEEHTAKVEAIQALEAGSGRKIIDVQRPYDEVLLQAKRAIWGALDATR